MASEKQTRSQPWIQRLGSRALALLGIRLFRLYYGEKDLLDAIPAVEPLIDLEVRQASEEDLRRSFTAVGPDERKRCAGTLAIGSTCFVALHQGQVAGYAWVNRRVIELLGHRVARLSENGSYTANGFVLPAYRGKKVFQSLTRAVYAQMKAEGYTFTCNLVDRGNVASLAARANLGARFQKTWILLLPGVGAVVLGRGFVLGASRSRQDAAPAHAHELAEAVARPRSTGVSPVGFHS